MHLTALSLPIQIKTTDVASRGLIAKEDNPALIGLIPDIKPIPNVLGPKRRKSSASSTDWGTACEIMVKILPSRPPSRPSNKPLNWPTLGTIRACPAVGPNFLTPHRHAFATPDFLASKKSLAGIVSQILPLPLVGFLDPGSTSSRLLFCLTRPCPAEALELNHPTHASTLFLAFTLSPKQDNSCGLG